jgi:hypothetical protein
MIPLQKCIELTGMEEWKELEKENDEILEREETEKIKLKLLHDTSIDKFNELR